MHHLWKERRSDDSLETFLTGPQLAQNVSLEWETVYTLTFRDMPSIGLNSTNTHLDFDFKYRGSTISSNPNEHPAVGGLLCNFSARSIRDYLEET